MEVASRKQIHRVTALLGTVAGLSGALVHRSLAQGCEPIRFTTPNVGMQGGSPQQPHEWRLTLGYRYLSSDQWFVGTSDHSERAPGGRSPIIKNHTFVADIGYSVTDRLAVHLSVPFSTGNIRRVYPAFDTALREQKASGIGDVSLSADIWVLNPSSHQGGNFSLGVGVQAPTGSNQVASQFYTANGPVPFAADQAIEPGSGGWGLSLQTRAFAKLFDRGFAYLSGAYTFTPQAHTDVFNMPSGGFVWAVADGYSGRLGLAYTILPKAGVSLSLGGRIDGTPVHDVVGGGDDAYRRPGFVIYTDPGIGLTQGRNYFSLNVPLRLAANRLKNRIEQQNGGLNGGGFAKALIFLAYSRRI